MAESAEGENILYGEINLSGLYPGNGIFMYCIITLFISTGAYLMSHLMVNLLQIVPTTIIF